jgi:N-acetylglucosamine kinase-like BadF-type ATPase
MSLKIGIDGGGSKTELILVDGAGTILARHVGPGCNPSHLGPDKARAILLEALQQLLARSSRLVTPGEIVATQLYMAGAPAFWRETAAGLAGFGRVTTDLDSLPVLELATGGRPGLVMHAGTGSFIAARALDGMLHYAGGVGWMFGDAGSGHDLGRRALGRALLELQGSTERTVLAEALCTYTGITDYAATSRYFYTTPDANARIAGFAPLALSLAKAGNAPALAALKDTLAEFVNFARQVSARLFGDSPVPCGISGAILNHETSTAILRELITTHAWPVKLNFITAPPIEGVRRLLAWS